MINQFYGTLLTYSVVAFQAVSTCQAMPPSQTFVNVFEDLYNDRDRTFHLLRNGRYSGQTTFFGESIYLLADFQI
jgi:hypothetical protein